MKRGWRCERSAGVPRHVACAQEGRKGWIKWGRKGVGRCGPFVRTRALARVRGQCLRTSVTHCAGADFQAVNFFPSFLSFFFFFSFFYKSNPLHKLRRRFVPVAFSRKIKIYRNWRGGKNISCRFSNFSLDSREIIIITAACRRASTASPPPLRTKSCVSRFGAEGRKEWKVYRLQ